MTFFGMSEPYKPPVPSPYCGRVDDHEPHKWTTPSARAAGKPKYECPGPPDYYPKLT